MRGRTWIRMGWIVGWWLVWSGAWILGAFGAGTPAAPAMVSGWRMELVLESPRIKHPSVVCSAPDGRVFVAEDPMDIRPEVPAESAAGRILCLHPDGRLTVFAEKLHAVFGMQYLEGYLFVLHNPKFSRFVDDHGVGRDRTELIEQTTPRPWALDWNDHVPANFRLGMDGYFYVAVGDKGLYGAVGRDGSRVTLHGGGILRLRPDGTRLQIVSRGVRNIMDVALNATDDCFTYDNTDEHDWMGRLTHMVEQGFYGYPHEFVPRRPYTLWMMHDFGGGAATGIECDNGASLPEEYHGNLFLGDFGKRQVLRTQLERQGATYRVVRHQEMFLNPPEDFRPVGIAWSSDERSLWICDWAHRDTKEAVSAGRLWRATFQEAKSPPRPAWFVPAAQGEAFTASDESLIQALSHPSRAVRLVAQRRLQARRGDGVRSRMVRQIREESAPELARVHALWALVDQDSAQAATLALGFVERGDRSLEMRRQSARVLGELSALSSAEALARRVADPLEDPVLRFHAATALGRVGNRRAVRPLQQGLVQEDLFARFAAFTAMGSVGRRHPDAWRPMVEGLGDSRASVRQATVFAFRETFDPELVRALMDWADGRADAAGRETVLRILASMARQQPAWDGGWWAYHPALSAAPKPTVDWAATPWIRARLVRGLEDPAPGVRRAAVEGIAEISDETSSAALLRSLNRELDPRVRVALLRAVAAIRPEPAAPQVAALLLNPPSDLELVRAAIAAAVALGGEVSGRGLLALAGNTHPARADALTALGTQRPAGSIPVLAAAVRDADTAVRLAAIQALGLQKQREALEVLQPLTQTGPASERTAATFAVGTLQLAEGIPLLIQLWRDRETREAALEGLIRRPDVRAVEAYLDGLSQVNPTLRERCRKALIPLKEDVLAIIESRVPTLAARAVAELRTVYDHHERAAQGPIFKFQAALPTPEDYARFAMDRRGDPVAGQRVFFDAAGVACIRCHAVAGQGSALGPDMTAIGAQFGRRELIENVLYPSRSVREGYQQVLIETRDGESHAGLVRSETAEAVVLVDASGQQRPIPKSTIVQRTNSPLSLMPEGLQAGISLEQFADLIAFLESRRSDPRAPVKRLPPDGWIPLLAPAADGVPRGWVELPAGTKRVDREMIQRGRPAEHWTIQDGVLEHDGLTGDLWTEREVADFELTLEWRWSGPFTWEEFPLINAEGLEAGPDGRAATVRVLDAGDSGVLLRGLYKAQANLFCYPVGSGEFWEYRTDPNSTPEQRRAFTPRRHADRPLGDWNEMRIRVEGTRVTVWLNGEEVIHQAELPGLPPRGPVGLQHEHGRLQFRNVFLRELGR